MSRRVGSRVSRRESQRPKLVLTARALVGSGPALTVTGRVRLPLSLSVTVAAGALGAALVTVVANGVTLLAGALSAALLSLSIGLTLSMENALYTGNAYTLVLP